MMRKTYRFKWQRGDDVMADIGQKPSKNARGKAKNSYDWDSLRAEYIRGEYKNLLAFAKAKRIPQRTLYRNSKGWDEARQKLAEKQLDTLARNVADEIKSDAHKYKLMLEGVIAKAVKRIKEDDIGFRSLGEAIKALDVGLSRLLQLSDILESEQRTDNLKIQIEVIGKDYEGGEDDDAGISDDVESGGDIQSDPRLN
jgi:hypothetical protein